MSFLKFLLGVVLLVRGSRLFWLFLGAVGFILAFDLAQHIIHVRSQSVTLAIAVFAGILGALAAILFQQYAVLAAGFFAGGHLFIELLKIFGMRVGDIYWIIFIVGGIVGAFLMSILFEWTLIIFSSFIGAALILNNVHLGHSPGELVFIGLGIFGIIVQSGLFKRKSA